MRVPAARVVAVVVLLCASLVPALAPRAAVPTALADVAGTCPVGQQLVSNGSFEQPGLPPGTDGVFYVADGWVSAVPGQRPEFLAGGTGNPLGGAFPVDGNVFVAGSTLGVGQNLPITPAMLGATLRLRFTALNGALPVVRFAARPSRVQYTMESPGVYTGTMTAPVVINEATTFLLFTGLPIFDDVSVTVESCPSNLAPLFDVGQTTQVVVPAAGSDGAIVNFATPTATDPNPGDVVTVTCDPAPGTRFPVGVTMVTCTASDGKDSRTTSIRVIVGDTNPPIMPDDLGAYTTTKPTADGARVFWPLSFAPDAEEGPLPIECDRPQGSMAPIGMLRITCTSTDSSGNVATKVYTVAVGSTDPPTFDAGTVTNLTVPATSSAGAVVAFAPGATSPEGNVLPVTCDRASGSVFPIGTTTVTCTATSLVGGTASTTFTVTVTPSGYREPRPDRPGASAPATATPSPVATERPVRPTRPGVTATPPPATATPRPTRAPRG